MIYEVGGIIMVTGKTNVGKTSFCHPPGYTLKQIAFANWDTKEPDISGKDPAKVYGFYKNYMAVLAEKKELLTVEEFLSDLEKIPKTVKILIVDGEETFRKSFTPYTLKHKAELADYWYGRGGQFKVMEELGFSAKFEALYFSKLQERFDMIFIVNHLVDARDETSDQEMKPIILGKQVANVKQLLVQKAKMRVWIVPTDDSLCPSAIVTKNPGMVREGKRGYETITYLPPKISPTVLGEKKGFVSLWDAISHYEKNPFSERYPNIEPYEMVTDSEREMISEDITDSDKRRIEQYALVLTNLKRIQVIEEVENVLKVKPNAPDLMVWAQVRKVLPEISQEEVAAVIASIKGK